MEQKPSYPVFPSLLKKPLSLIPSFVNSRVLAIMLNRIFREQLDDGDLDFFESRVLDIDVRDAGLRYRITMRNRQFRPSTPGNRPEVTFSGTVYDFMVLAAGEADPDTLFFQRRLRLSGDTELGLYLKNFLSALDPERIPRIISYMSPKMLAIYERVLGR